MAVVDGNWCIFREKAYILMEYLLDCMQVVLMLLCDGGHFAPFVINTIIYFADVEVGTIDYTT